jgi:hypothetical protein
MGVFAMGAGFYNQQTAVADSINAETVKRWNEYLYQSQLERNRRFWARQARNRESNIRTRSEMQDRLRNNPEPRDVSQGSALNVALDEINDPRVYTKALKGADTKISGEKVRLIPFQYNAAGITMSIHQLATDSLPSALRRSEFAADRDALRSLDQQILDEIDENDTPNPATVQKFLAAVIAAEEKAATLFPPNGLDAKQASRYLMALHGLVAMLKAPVLDEFLNGVEKRPEVTLGELLNFMTAFNLRFGPATTPAQRTIYSELFPQLVRLRDQVAPKIESASFATTGTEAEAVFSGISPENLNKKAPKPSR